MCLPIIIVTQPQPNGDVWHVVWGCGIGGLWDRGIWGIQGKPAFVVVGALGT